MYTFSTTFTLQSFAQTRPLQSDLRCGVREVDGDDFPRRKGAADFGVATSVHQKYKLYCAGELEMISGIVEGLVWLE